LIKGFGDEIKKKIVFVVEGNVPIDVNDRSIETKTIEAIISESDTNKLETPYNGSEKTKTIAAMEFRTKVLNGEMAMDEMTREGFRRLLNGLGIVFCDQGKVMDKYNSH